MTRKFKLAGALMAVVAMFALTASSASAIFTSAAYPATGSGSSTADKFEAFGSTVTCTENTFTGTLVEASTTLTITPSYKNCTGFGLPATVNFTGCDYLFHHITFSSPPFEIFSFTVDLVCPKGVKGVDITIYSSGSHLTALCHVVVTPFTGKGSLNATNSGNHVVLTGSVGGMVAHQERTNFLCPAGTETSSAAYKVQPEGITMAGNNGAISVS